jgi:ubiquinone/menaquinone biosynthesis C-methylase UbiE
LERNSGLSGLISVVQGAFATKVLVVALEIELFTRVSKGAETVDRVSQECGINVELLRMLTNACKAIGILQGRGDALKNSPAAETFLVKGKEGYVGDFMEMVGEQYYDIWRSFKDVMIIGKPVRDDRVVRLSDPKYAETHIRSMHGISLGHARDLASGLGLSGKKSMLEIGGGRGTYSVALTKANPRLKATVFDSPFSCDIAEKYIKEEKSKSVTTQGGDYVMDSIPKGHDVIMLTHVMQTLSPEKCEALMRKVYDSLERGGSVIVNEFRLDKEATSPVFSALFALNAFMLSNGGKIYTQAQISEWLSNVGFQGVKLFKASSEFIVSLTGTKA